MLSGLTWCPLEKEQKVEALGSLSLAGCAPRLLPGCGNTVRRILVLLSQGSCGLFISKSQICSEVIVNVQYEILPSGKFIDMIPQLNIIFELYLEVTL